MKRIMILMLGLAMLSGCRSTYNANAADRDELSGEGSVVVVRPDFYSLLGTRSMRDYLEVVYEEFDVNPAGYPVVRLGLRVKGGQHWWDLQGRNFTLYAKTVFYRDPVVGTDVRSAPLFTSNRQAVTMRRGETSDIIITCPVKEAGGYQILLSEK